jgi:small GTP-binding protein
MPGHAAAIGARAAAAAAASPGGGGGVSTVSSRVGPRQPLLEQPPRLPIARAGTPPRAVVGAGPIAAAPVGASARPKPTETDETRHSLVNLARPKPTVPPLGAAAPPKPPVAPPERTPGEELGFVKQVGVDEEPTSPSTPPLPTPPPPPAASAAAKAAAAAAVAAFTLPYERSGSGEDASKASKGVAASKAAGAASSEAAERKAEAAERKAFEAYVSSEPPSSDSEDEEPTTAPTTAPAPAPAPPTADKAFALKKGLCLDLSKLRAEDSTPYDPKALPVGIGGAAAVASPAIPKLGLGKPPIPALKLGLAGLGAVSGDGSAAGSEIKPADLRALLKLDLGSISQAGDAQRASGRDGETRPTWEFDLSEITLGHRIGAGAFGEVYEASWRRSRIAVKRLLCQRLTETARREFMQEMQLMSNLRHPHIVRFLGACLEPLQMSILFELCASSLYTVLHVQKQPLQLEYAMGLIRQIALGIFYLHQCKEPVLHLDLKSANVLLDEHGVAKVADFGLSHIKKETAVITARMGSPQWTAPEILRGQPHDESADTYSFGVLMYEIMAARLPYLGIDTFQVVMGVITKMLPRPQLPAECAFPQLLQEMMANCWRESPQERPRFNAILDMADEALETLAMRPQLAGAGGKKAKHAIALDVSRSQRSPPSSHGSDRASSRYGSDRGSTARSAMLETPPRSSYGSGYGSATETDQPQQPQPRQLLKLGLPSVAPNLALQQGGALALHESRQANRAVAIALVDYVGQAFDELSFKRGDTIRDVEPHSDALGTALRSGEGPISPIAELRAAGEGGLWMGTLRGRRGLFRGAQVCMSRLGAPTGGVAHTETPLAEAYDMVGATLLSAGHGYEIFSATALDGLHGPPVQLSLLRADDPDWRARAERHAALMSEVTAAGASHVLPLLRVVRPPRGPHVTLVCPHLSGGDLFDRLERFGPMPEALARRVAQQILGGLSQLHTLRICHGNLQPAAVLFESPHLDETALRLADLRCARQLPAGAVPSATALERATGVPDYSSPEALSWMVPGARRVGFGLATDVWSAGVVLYTALCGFAPFRAESPAQLLKLASSGRLDFPTAAPTGTGTGVAAGAGAGAGAGGETTWARISPAAKELMRAMLQVDATQRPTAEAALNHPWVRGEYDQRAVRASVAALRDRSRGWSQLLTDSEGGDGGAVLGSLLHDGRAAGGARGVATPSAPRQIRQSRSGEWELGAGGFGAGALGKTPSSEGRSAGAGGAGTHHPPTLRVDAARAATPFNLGAWIKSKLGFTQRQLKVLLLGLDAAGKSTLLQRLRHGDEAPATSMPTIGHDVERFEHAEAVYTLYDVGGQRQLRGQWERYFALEDLWGSAAERVSGIIFVVDAADASRFGEARQELHKLLSEPRLRGVPLLVLANKMDLPTARPLPEVEAALGVAERDPRPDGARCAVQGACSLCGDGVVAALEWIAAAAPA